MKQKVKVYSAFAGREVEYDAEIMTSDELTLNKPDFCHLCGARMDGDAE